jgi:hypothetical protein
MTFDATRTRSRDRPISVWACFILESVRQAIEEMIDSWRQDHSVTGRLRHVLISLSEDGQIDLVALAWEDRSAGDWPAVRNEPRRVPAAAGSLTFSASGNSIRNKRLSKVTCQRRLPGKKDAIRFK